MIERITMNREIGFAIVLALAMSVCLLAAVIAAPANAASVQVVVTGTDRINMNVPVPWVFVPIAAFLSDCPGVSVHGVTVEGGPPGQPPEMSLDISGIISSAPEIVNDLITLTPPGATVAICDDTVHPERIVHVEGGFSLYSVAAGSLQVFRQGSATVSFTDTIAVESDIATTIAFPVRLTSSGFAAESFGNSGITRGSVSASFSGTAGGVPLSGGGYAIESVTVIPENGSIDLTENVFVDVLPGINVIPFSVQGDFMVTADAAGGGLFGSITGSSTAGLSLPGSFEVLVPVLSDGSALPPGISVYSLDDDSVYVPEPRFAGTLSVGVLGMLGLSARKRRLTDSVSLKG